MTTGAGEFDVATLRVGEHELETWKDYHKTAGREMAEQIAKDYVEELAERLHWEERDVETV